MRLVSLFILIVLLGGIGWAVTSKNHPVVAAAIASDASPADGPMAERTMGKADAPVTMIEYFSLTCPHCAKFEQTTFKQFKTDYIDTGKVRYIARDFPFDKAGLHAAMLARCADPSRYFPLVDLLFKGQENWGLSPDPDAAMAPLAKFAGLSDESIKSCLANTALQDFVVNERKTATDKYKVDSTPNFVFNDGAAQFSGDRPYDTFKSTIDALLNGQVPPAVDDSHGQPGK